MDNRLPLIEITEQAAKSAPAFAKDEVSLGKRVTMHFSLAFANTTESSAGEIIDSNFDRAPVTFTLGDGNLLPGFEKSLLGSQAGTEKTLRLKSEDAFGAVNEDNIQTHPRYQFPADLVLEKGLMINFSDAAGNNQAGIVKSFDSEKVTVDFNHPLAGAEIEFKVKIIAVESDAQ